MATIRMPSIIRNVKRYYDIYFAEKEILFDVLVETFITNLWIFYIDT